MNRALQLEVMVLGRGSTPTAARYKNARYAAGRAKQQLLERAPGRRGNPQAGALLWIVRIQQRGHVRDRPRPVPRWPCAKLELGITRKPINTATNVASESTMTRRSGGGAQRSAASAAPPPAARGGETGRR